MALEVVLEVEVAVMSLVNGSNAGPVVVVDLLRVQYMVAMLLVASLVVCSRTP